MKKKKLFSAIIILFLSQFNYILAQECGTKFSKCDANRMKVLRENSSKLLPVVTGIQSFKIKHHFVLTPRTYQALTKPTLEQYATKVLHRVQDDFFPLHFINSSEINIIAGQQYSYFKYDEWWFSRYDDPTAINIYYFEALYYSDGTALNGIARSPLVKLIECNSTNVSYVKNKIREIGSQGVAVSLDAVRYNGQGPNYSLSTVSHELGHYFMLFHTFETSTCRENVLRNNCERCGDRVCDTPADPYSLLMNGNSIKYLYKNCKLERSISDGSADYKPDLSNIMSYAVPRSCRTGFSSGQMERMTTFGAPLRTLLIESYNVKYSSTINKKQKYNVNADKRNSISTPYMEYYYYYKDFRKEIHSFWERQFTDRNASKRYKKALKEFKLSPNKYSSDRSYFYSKLSAAENIYSCIRAENAEDQLRRKYLNNPYLRKSHFKARFETQLKMKRLKVLLHDDFYKRW